MTEFTSVGADMSIKDCKVCGPYVSSKCKLAHASCPYRDLDTSKDA